MKIERDYTTFDTKLENQLASKSQPIEPLGAAMQCAVTADSMNHETREDV